MGSRRVRIPGPRAVRGTIDSATATGSSVVVACPPHPQHGGTGSDPRLRAVSRALCARGIDCLRLEYGPWDDGRGERDDARRAIEWSADGGGYERIGLFGYSFGAGVALLAADSNDGSVVAVAALAPVDRVGDGMVDVARAFESFDGPMLIVVGDRDDAVDWRSVVSAAPPSVRIESIPGDHHFVGRFDRIGATVGDFFEAAFVGRP